MFGAPIGVGDASHRAVQQIENLVLTPVAAVVPGGQGPDPEDADGRRTERTDRIRAGDVTAERGGPEGVQGRISPFGPGTLLPSSMHHRADQAGLDDLAAIKTAREDRREGTAAPGRIL